jgi:hypothetical protein
LYFQKRIRTTKMMEVIWEKDNLPHRETIAIWDEHPYYVAVNPGRVPTEEELTACPKIFTCFSCLEKHPQKELGGRYHEKWFCCYCIPFVDDWTAGAMLWWEEKRKKRHFGNPPKGSPPLTQAEREEHIWSAIRWCVANGYPIQTEETEGGSDNDR